MMDKDDLSRRIHDITAASSKRAAAAIVAKVAPDGFHWRNGIFFRLTPDDAIQIVETNRPNPCAGGGSLPDRAVAVIPRAEWRSIVEYTSEGSAHTDAELLATIGVMMSRHVENWPNPKRVSTAIALVSKALFIARDALLQIAAETDTIAGFEGIRFRDFARDRLDGNERNLWANTPSPTTGTADTPEGGG